MEHIGLKELINKCITGDIQMGKPIILTSKDRSQTTKVSFLNHLIKYNGIKQDLLFTFYFKILGFFNKMYKKMMSDETFDKFIQHIKKEWNVEENILYEHDFKLDNSRKTIEELLENMNILCRQFRELNGRVRNNNMNDVIVEDEMMENMDGFLESVKSLSTEKEEISGMIDPIIEDINKLNTGILLDLSMKDKSMYLEMSDVDENNKIPDNINISFLNYVYIINLIKKHIIYYRRILSKVNDISGNMSKYVEDSRETIKSKDNLFQLNPQHDSIEEYLRSLTSEYDTQMMAPAGVED
tara:strand:- start:115 stop:1008 length:894 start_codon:yes stop_codon:yes gene_type:complete